VSVDWEKLKLFDCVAEAGSFTEAARRLHMSQPALSRQIAALEESVGAKLFHRHARGLVLTHEGEQLHDSTREVSDRIGRGAAGDDGQLRIDVAGAANGRFPSAISRYFSAVGALR
jgi:DNA-binding transcriptional LysR family regulator